MNPDVPSSDHRFAFRTWVAAVLVASAALIVAGYWYYRIQVEYVEQKAYDEISAVGVLKSGDIQQWRKERLSVVNHVGRDPLVARQVEQLLRSPDDPEVRTLLLSRMRAEGDEDAHANALLVAPDGTLLVAAREDAVEHPERRDAIEAARAGRGPVLSDIYRTPDGSIFIDAAAAVRSAEGRTLAVAILRSDVAAYLYPLIESWPAPSRSAETFLVRRSGDTALWLSNVRNRPDSALSFRQPLTNVALPAVQAVLGRQGVFEGRDYRGVPVLADLRRIDGSPWFIVAKIDLDEVLADTRYHAGAITLVVSLFILLGLAALAYVYRSRQALALRDCHELELREREERYLRQRNALIALIQSKALNSDDLPTAFRHITEVAAGTLGVARVSVWRYDAGRTAIRCDDLYQSGDARHSSGAELTASSCPAYFAALSEAPVIVANDARTDPRTADFNDGYLIPLGITSMLDVPILVGGAVVGVLCHEHVGPPRVWTADESAFAVAVANTVSPVLEGHERRRAEAGLRLQSAALNAASSAIVITTRDGVIEWVNHAFTELSGYTEGEAIGRNPGDLMNSGMHDARFYADLWNTILAGHVWRGEMTNRRKDGTHYLEGMSITPVRVHGGDITHFVAIKRDLTEAKQLEAQLLQSQKMEVVGRLAGGIAHDFNNLLTVINGTAELMASSLPDGHPLRPDLREIELAGSRAATLTRQLLAFSRKQVLTPEVLDLTTLLADLRSMLQRLIGEDITLTIATAKEGSWIRADKGQIEQVLMNLVVNSRDAMPHGGTVTITAGDDVDPGHVLIEVRDTGTGMDEATLARLFEPFFTTKAEGKGTGLGLATVYGIVRQSGGTIDVHSAPGAGATFSIRLPRVPADAPAHSPGPPAGRSEHETILVVEDDDRVRQMTGRMLETSGYRVLTASSGAQAIRILEAHAQPIHVMLTDVVMPGMSGPELVRRAAGVRPDLRVVYMSGHTDNEALRVAVFSKTARFIGKPFAREDLARLIRDTLDSPQIITRT